MATTLFEVLVATARALRALQEGIATGGSATTIVDSGLAGSSLYPDDVFNNGVAFVIQTTDGASPQGKSRAISDWAASTGTATIPTVTDAVQAGDVYGLMTNRYTRGELVGAVNEALGEAGHVPTEDVSLTTLADTREYNLPVAAKRDLRQVWLAQATAAPYAWEAATGWYVEHAAAGSAGNLIFDYQPRVGYKIKLVYLARHPYVQADTDGISDYLAVEWLGVEAARRAARRRLQGAGAGEKALVSLINDLDNELARLKRLHPIARPQSTPHLPFASERFPAP